MRIEHLRRPDRLAAECAHGLQHDRLERGTGARLKVQHRVIVADELHAIGGRNEHPPIGLHHGANADERGELRHQRVALIEKPGSGVPDDQRVLDLRI
jgi:hypothetical protein